MLFLLALISHILGHKIPLWITGQKMRDIRAKGGLRQLLFEMSGVIFVFALAFIAITLDGLTTKETYLQNKKVNYGLHFNQKAKDLGFKNGDNIISVNDEPTVEFNEIIDEILYSAGQTRIVVRRENHDTIIVLSVKEMHGLIEGGVPFEPLLDNDTSSVSRNDIVYSERQRSLSKSIELYPQSVRLAFRYVLQIFTPIDESTGGYIILFSHNEMSFLRLLGLSYILFGFLNLLPIPGLDLGNTCIALIESARKKKYNPRRIKHLRHGCLGIISILLIFIVLYS